MTVDGDEPGADGEGDEGAFEALLQHLQRSRGFDFSGYKSSSLKRRVRKRMHMIGVTDFADYVDYIEVHPEEFALLFNTILINVTAFFRDSSAWDYLATDVVPRVIASKPADEPIRVWSAGCASGEEAYTLAIVLAEALGPEAFRERVKVYATDIDDGALARARLAVYEARDLDGVPAAVRERYFEQVDHRYAFLKEYRRAVIFGRHDLFQDAPISRIDLLVCRNTLMYFNSETQARILERFHFALGDNGFLFLGKAETLMTYSSTFTPVDLKRRIFAKIPRGNLRERLLSMARAGGGETAGPLVNHIRLREIVFETVPLAQIVVDQNGLLVMANERARAMFRLSTSDVGRPLQDLNLSYRPVELRSCIDRALADRQPVLVSEVEWRVEPESAAPCYIDVQVFPLFNGASGPLGTSISFTDVTLHRKLQNDLQAANRELESAYEELQSTIEELETTNEELQSTNEELETMNEELQSTNEELQTLNEELRERSDELNEVNSYLESILRSFRGGVVVVDSNLLVQIWNHRAEDLWGLRSTEVVGKPLLNLDIGLPVENLKQSLRRCLSGGTDPVETTLAANNRRGKAILCRVSCTPLRDAEQRVAGAIMLMSEHEPETEPAPSHSGKD